MKFRAVLVLLAACALSNACFGAGVGPWSFGMNRDAVRSFSDFGPYYSFKNDDIGTQGGQLDGKTLRTSFYFNNDRLARVMFITYQGEDFAGVQEGWEVCLQHLRTHFKDIEVPRLHAGAASEQEARDFLAKSELQTDATKRAQMGPLHMPTDKQVWCSAARSASTYMVSLNYAEP